MPDTRVQSGQRGAPQEEETDGTAVSRGARIAVVDTDPTFLSLLIELFWHRDWTCIPCDDGLLAGALIRSHVPDLVLLDVWLETPTAGWDLLTLLKRDPVTRDIPVIVCSGAIDHLARGEARLKEEAAAVVTKPFDVDDLCATVSRILIRDRAGRPSEERVACLCTMHPFGRTLPDRCSSS